MKAHKSACLNCGAVLTSAYCPECGQKSDTHRISLAHLIKHDLVHGVWHFDRGLLFTLRESFLRPGHMAMDYINGKRVKYYNIFYLILIVLGINALTAHYFKAYYNITNEGATEGLVINEDGVDISYYLRHYFKLLLFLVIPLFALSGLASFRKLKLNFAEHAIIAGNILLTGAIWYFFVIVVMYTNTDIDSDFLDIMVLGLVVVAWLQPARVYYQAVRKEYTAGAFLLHVLQWYANLAFLLFLVLLVIALFTGKSRIHLN